MNTNTETREFEKIFKTNPKLANLLKYLCGDQDDIKRIKQLPVSRIALETLVQRKTTLKNTQLLSG